MTAATTAWRAGIAAVQAEAAGVLHVYLVPPEQGMDLVAAVAQGDPTAATLLRAIMHASEQIEAAPWQKPALCVCCPRPIRSPFGLTFGVMLPDEAVRTQGIGFAVCERCSAEPGEVLPKVTTALRRMFPDSRPINITHPEGGRA